MKALLVPLLVVGTVVSMLVPLPPLMIDFLIGANLIFALGLLLSAFALTDTLKLTSLPSLLLLATVFRLALNVSSTRNILGSGEAGQVIDAFGKVVVNGNLIVGVVIFSVITLVQFIVIAKGSERVAEVAARFTLDAMPGKQMSIDADLRAGLLDMNQARAKRQDLQTESRFYGALDGAMKFVKGDAIAGIVITLINLIGGITVGVLIADLDFASAIQKYCLLTVGDGLTAQIPSLLNSLAAGVVVTRVSRGDERTLAQDLIQQLSAVRSVKVIIGVFSLGLAFAPEMPVLPFLTLAGLLLFSAATQGADADQSPQIPAQWTPRLPALISICLDSATFTKIFGGSEQLEGFNRSFREAVFKTSGLLLPNLEFVPDAMNTGVTIKVRDVVAERSSELASATALEESLHTVIQRHIVELLDDSMTRRLIDALDPVASETATTVIPSVISVTQVTELLKQLVSEGISIRNFDVILQAVSEHAARSANSRVLLEEVRIALRRVVCTTVLTRDGVTDALKLNPLLDYEISKLEREGAPLTLAMMEMLEAFLKEHLDVPLLLVSRGARRLVKQFAELHRIGTRVAAFEELIEGAAIRFVASLEATVHEEERVVA